jgi:hypothetical protein
MREYVLHGWNEEKCQKHQENAKEGGFKTQCDREGKCVYTGAPHVQLSYEECELLQDVFYFNLTGEIFGHGIEYRQSVVYLVNKLHELQQQKEKLEYGTRRGIKI